MKSFDDYRPALSEIPAHRFWLYLVILFLCALGNALLGCNDERRIYNTFAPSDTTVLQDSTTCTWHKHKKHHHHGQWCCPFQHMKKDPEEHPESREGNPDFNTGAGNGGGDRGD